MFKLILFIAVSFSNVPLVHAETLAPGERLETFTFRGYNPPRINDGTLPTGGLLRQTTESEPIYYGTTDAGGTHNAGTIYMIYKDPETKKLKDKILYSFWGEFQKPNGDYDVGCPEGRLVKDSQGALWGAATVGGWSTDGKINYANGGIFKLVPTADGHWRESVAIPFSVNVNFGTAFVSSLTQDEFGNMYGVVSGLPGGLLNEGPGYVFQIDVQSHGADHPRLNVIHVFNTAKPANNASGVFGGVTLRSDEHSIHLYGLSGAGCLGYGGVYELQIAKSQVTSNNWQYSNLYSFPSTQVAYAGLGALTLVQNAGGWSLLGTALYTPKNTNAYRGQVFSVSIPMDATPSQFTAIYKVTKGAWAPVSGVGVGASGDLYTTMLNYYSAEGEVVQMKPPTSPGSSWSITSLYRFNNQSWPDSDAPLVLSLKRGEDVIADAIATTGGGFNTLNGGVYKIHVPQ
jgi:hypothetical protein